MLKCQNQTKAKTYWLWLMVGSWRQLNALPARTLNEVGRRV